MLYNDRQQGTVPGPRDGARTRAARHRPGGGVPARQPNVAAPLDQLRPAALLPRRWAAGAALPPRRSARVSGADRRARAGAPRWAPVRTVHEWSGAGATGRGLSGEGAGGRGHGLSGGGAARSRARAGAARPRLARGPWRPPAPAGP